jgi:membrane protein YdbS with pleckstrin-like domain
MNTNFIYGAMTWVSEFFLFVLIIIFVPIWIIPFWCYKAWKWNKDRIAQNQWLFGYGVGEMNKNEHL